MPRHAACAALLATLAAMSACSELRSGMTASDAGPALPPVLARIRDTYPDCRSGRFVCLAAFESPKELELFRVTGDDAASRAGDQPEISIRHARNETGAGSMRLRLADSIARLVFDADQARELTFIRDWSPYTLLLFSVFNPAEGADLTTTISSGAEQPLRWQSSTRIEPGWNLVRIDLADAGDRIELADVRRIEWSATGSGPIELFFDDILLTDNRQNVAGSGAAAGELFVYREGASLHVASLDRFDVALRNGVIVRCGAAEGTNLAAADGLGPWPITQSVGDEGDGGPKIVPVASTPYPRDSTATEQLVESSPSRVVVEYQHTLSEPGAPLRTRYTFYPDGRAYYQISWPVAESGAHRALAIEAAENSGAVALRGAAGSQSRGAFILFARRGPTEHDLLWAPAEPAQATVAVAQRRGEAGAFGTIAPWPSDVAEAAGLLVFWPTDLNGAPEAESIAGDYQFPGRITTRTGTLRTDVEGDLNGDGFNESEGCYEIETFGGVARFTFDPRKRLRHEPRIRVHEVRGMRCWAYADGRILEPLRRDGQDNLIVQLPRLAGGPMNVEVHAAAVEPKPAPASQPATAPGWFR